MSQWDNVEPMKVRSTYADEVNARINSLEAENELLSAKIKTTVVNRRTGKRATKTLYQINCDRQVSCVARYWTRIPKSNSLMIEFRAVQNSHNVTQD